MRTCPRQGLNLSLTGYVFFNRFKKSCLKSRFQKSFNCNIIANKTLQNCVKQGSVYFLLRPEQGLKIEGGVQHRVYILGLFCPTQGQGLKPSAAPLYPTIGQVPPPPGGTPSTASFSLVLLSLLSLESESYSDSWSSAELGSSVTKGQ